MALLCLDLLNFPCHWIFKLFLVFTKRVEHFGVEALLSIFPPSGFGFPEVKFLGQSFLILIAKWLSGNVPTGTPPSTG